MKALFPLTVCCISLLSLQLQARPAGDRLELMKRLHQLRVRSHVSTQSNPGSVDPTVSPAIILDRTALWRALLVRSLPSPFENPRSSSRVPRTARSVGGTTSVQEEETNQIRTRSRRHAFIRSPLKHGQLMRVGCVLGTCQVQNLGHRLYQLVGQAGREDSSPKNLHSPHSYG